MFTAYFQMVPEKNITPHTHTSYIFINISQREKAMVNLGEGDLEVLCAILITFKLGIISM